MTPSEPAPHGALAARAPPAAPLAPGGGAVLAVLTALLLWFGVYPAPLLRLIGAAAAFLP